MDEQYCGMPETDWLVMALDDLRMRSSIERVGDDILVCDNLDGDEIYDGFKFAREEKHDNTEGEAKAITELMNEELDISKEMELLEKWYKKKK